MALVFYINLYYAETSLMYGRSIERRGRASVLRVSSAAQYFANVSHGVTHLRPPISALHPSHGTVPYRLPSPSIVLGMLEHTYAFIENSLGITGEVALIQDIHGIEDPQALQVAAEFDRIISIVVELASGVWGVRVLL